MLRKVALSCMLISVSAPLTYASTTTMPQTATVTAPTTSANSNLPVEEVQRFTTAMAQVKKYYVSDVDNQKLFDSAIRGMLAGLDPHSNYLDAKDFPTLQSNTTGEFGGLGIEIGSKDGYIEIVTPLDDTPAQRAGLKAGDLIIKIDNQPVEDMDLNEAVNKMRGPANSKVLLTIYRKGGNGPKTYTLTREVIRVQSVKSRMLEDGFGYIRISQFQIPTINDLNTALAKLKTENGGKNLNGVILDLRNNPGGLLDAAVSVSDAFLDSKKMGKNSLIVYTKGRMKDSQVDAHATAGDLLNGAPIVVLINEGSASAAEIVAGALQDHRRAVVMGTPTFGKGSVQTVLPIDDKTAIKLTTALYYTPNGKSIQAKGIQPDILVDNLDVKMDKKSKQLAMLTFKESDLSSHLANGNTPPAGKNTEPKNNVSQSQNATTTHQDASNEAQPLAVTDYQLYEALNLLKGLNTVRHSGMS